MARKKWSGNSTNTNKDARTFKKDAAKDGTGANCAETNKRYKDTYELVEVQPRKNDQQEGRRDIVVSHESNIQLSCTNAINKDVDGNDDSIGGEISRVKTAGVKFDVHDNRTKNASEDQPEEEQFLPRMHCREDKAERNVVGLAWITLIIVFVFIICQSVKLIPNFYEMVKVIDCNLAKYILFVKW